MVKEVKESMTFFNEMYVKCWPDKEYVKREKSELENWIMSKLNIGRGEKMRRTDMVLIDYEFQY
jgi:hypothetical protein